MGTPCLSAVGAYNGLMAVLAEQAGFDALWVSSFEVSACRALPDASLLTMSEYLQAAIHVDRASSLPVIADCDTGFGSSMNVAHLVREYEAAGIAAVCIEDKVFPKANSFAAHNHELLDADAFAHKLWTGKSVQRTEDFLLIARTEAFIAGCDTQEAIHRAELYAEAGADAVLIHSKEDTPFQIKDFLTRWSGRCPVVIVPTTYPEWSSEEADEAGVAMRIYANHGLRSTISSVRQTFETIIAEGGSSKVETDIASLAEVFAIQRMDEWLALEA